MLSLHFHGERHQEGGPAGEAAFCRFISEGAKQGLGVQLFADPTQDFRFIKNCSATKDT